ncbi:asialoglycoprotein receptor 1-like [Labeo rohita]|uniref:asialoglycoprotein receptor 1-like n=1 Tax=Labeo rohita TaxID=84645 RepID=UPI0021E2B454|nr:asialoglycoprotein receptor 1-like [Labeo rohita]XP_050949053.1 asialoglycoprotein receptor 1-like [Labeo rohita]
MDYYGKWFDFPCDFTEHNFICYDGRENATQSYIRVNDGKTWSEAHRYCRDHYTDLVNVRNQTENQKIIERAGGGVWIGLYRNRTWSDHQITSYQNWRPQIPDYGTQPDNGEDYISTHLWQNAIFSIVLLYHSAVQADGQMRSVYPACLSSATAETAHNCHAPLSITL